MLGDSEHEILHPEELKHGELHRFINADGQEYSAIYENGVEIFSTVRKDEDGMIAHANEFFCPKKASR